MQSILVIEKFPILRDGLETYLNLEFSDLKIVAVAMLRDLPVISQESCPTVILIGLNDNPKIDNIELIRLTKQLFFDSSIILYDESADYAMIGSYNMQGIKGYVTKQNNLDEFRECIARVLDGGSFYCQQIREFAAQHTV